MLGRRTSIEDAYKRYAGYTVNGDGFHRENYMKEVEPRPKAQ
uniref:Uncharacterized protein n=1 Tax=Parascaris equorum TaxID=6256 RepID=A0A914RVP1_PAREQ